MIEEAGGPLPLERASPAVSDNSSRRPRLGSDTSEPPAIRHKAFDNAAVEAREPTPVLVLPGPEDKRKSTPSHTGFQKCPALIVYKRFEITGNELYDYGAEINQIRYILTPDIKHKTSGEHAGEMSRERIVPQRQDPPCAPPRGVRRD